jgi:hypothetical protein
MTALSCYTANLVEYLSGEDPGVPSRLAAAIRLAVRADEPGGALAFSHHARIDRGTLGYRSAASWADTRAQLSAAGRALVVTDTAYVPWSPYPPDAHGPHWILVLGGDGERWHVVDRFGALTMHGRQRPHEGWLTDEQLRRAMTPVPSASAAVTNRDAHALGERISLPPAAHYRWLARVPPVSLPAVEWLEGVPALRRIATRLLASERALAEHVDDLWAAAVHQRFRLALVEGARPLVEAWTKLPRSLRFAVESARRGRPRPDLVTTAFDRVIAATEDLTALSRR